MFNLQVTRPRLTRDIIAADIHNPYSRHINQTNVDIMRSKLFISKRIIEGEID